MISNFVASSLSDTSSGGCSTRPLIRATSIVSSGVPNLVVPSQLVTSNFVILNSCDSNFVVPHFVVPNSMNRFAKSSAVHRLTVG